MPWMLQRNCVSGGGGGGLGKAGQEGWLPHARNLCINTVDFVIFGVFFFKYSGPLGTRDGSTFEFNLPIRNNAN